MNRDSLASNGKVKWSASAPWIFRGKEYLVSGAVKEKVLTLEVEEQLAADRWKAQFEAKHIEELTRKTGNFKKFSTFLNMLESAITKSSDSVALDLLTYEDLEDIWDKKLGPTSRRSVHSPVGKPQAKRFLILTYSVEFDRIHYPLALSYCGQPDPIILQNIIRKLQAELDSSRKGSSYEYKNSSLQQLQEENAVVFQEKQRLQEELLSLRHELMISKQNDSSKAIRVLKKVVKNLEEEVLKGHTKYQKTISRKNEDIKELFEELKELKLSERLLQTKVKTLTSELATYKRGIRLSTSSKQFYERRRSNSTERGKIERGRQSSGDRKNTRSRTRTPSPYARFDPTAYVEQKRKRLQAEAGHRKLKVSEHSRSRSSSVDRVYKAQHHALSASLDKMLTMPTPHSTNRRIFARNHRSNSPRYPSHSRESSTERRTPSTEKKTRSSSDVYRSDKEVELGSLKQSAEISEIDARLNALQDFMKRSLESAKQKTKTT